MKKIFNIALLLVVLFYGVSFAVEPAALPIWDENDTNTIPISTELQDDGFSLRSKPASGTFNSWFRNVYKWTEWFQEKFGLVDTELEKLAPVDSIAALRAITYTPTDGQVILVLGYYSKIENRDWTYKWNSTITEADKGGKYIKVASIATGRWVALINEDYDIARWGATSTASSVSIQNCIVDAYADSVNVTSSPANYGIDKTIIIPQNYSTQRRFTIDFKNSVFFMLADVTFLTSGYDNAGTLTTNFGTVLDTYNSFGMRLENFVVRSSIGTLSAELLQIQDWHQNSEISNINSNDSKTFLNSINNYYMNFTDLTTFIALPTSGDSRFIYSGAHNLCRWEGIVAANAGTQHEFNGGLTACQFTNMSFEGADYGIVFNSQVYDCVIENSYFEVIHNTCIWARSFVDNLTIKNNYVNFVGEPTMYFVDYIPTTAMNINVHADNHYEQMTGEDKIFKTLSETSNLNKLTYHKPQQRATSIDELLVDNTIISSRFTVNQELELYPGGKAKIVNFYAPGIYAGQYSDGFASLTGAEWTDNTSNVLEVRTKILFSETQRLYVSVRLDAPGWVYLKGEFIGSQFYEFTGTGLVLSTALSMSVVGNYVQIDSPAQAGVITAVVGEVRLM